MTKPTEALPEVLQASRYDMKEPSPALQPSPLIPNERQGALEVSPTAPSPTQEWEDNIMNEAKSEAEAAWRADPNRPETEADGIRAEFQRRGQVVHNAMQSQLRCIDKNLSQEEQDQLALRIRQDAELRLSRLLQSAKGSLNAVEASGSSLVGDLAKSHTAVNSLNSHVPSAGN